MSPINDRRKNYYFCESAAQELRMRDRFRHERYCSSAKSPAVQAAVTVVNRSFARPLVTGYWHNGQNPVLVRLRGALEIQGGLVAEDYKIFRVASFEKSLSTPAESYAAAAKYQSPGTKPSTT